MLRNNSQSPAFRRTFRASIAPALLALCATSCVDQGEKAPPFLGVSADPVQSAELSAVIVEAEDGENGSDLEVVTDADNEDITYVAAALDNIEEPADLDDPRISTSQVEFALPGEYQILVRARIGEGGSMDDSFYINIPGGEEPAWALLNSLSGYTVEGEDGYQEGDIVAETGGNGGTGVWKWILLPVVTFVVPEGELTQTFQFATREDGLDLDKFAFARMGDGFTTGFTTAQLDAGEAGVQVFPAPLPMEYLRPVDAIPLAGVGREQPKYLGMVCCGNQAVSLENYFNQIVPENAGKWGSVEGTRDVYNWDGVDEALALAEENNFPFRFHVLLWGSQQPAWLAVLPPEEQLEEITEWMEAVNERYGTRIDFLEVANEFQNQPPTAENQGNYVDALGGAGESGFDWVVTGFRMAREIFPASVQLMLNEYSVINNDMLTSTYVQLVETLQAENLIDAIGVQGHAFSTRGDVAAMTANIDRLGATGLSVYITEMDIDGPPMQQLIDYQRLFSAFWENPNVGGITLWGYRAGMWRDDQEATLVYANGAEKLALRWLKGYVGNVAPVVSGDDTATSAADADMGTEVVTLSADSADGATVSWGIALGNEDAPAIGTAFAFAEGTGRLERVGPIVAGTYTVRAYVDVDAVLSDLHEIVITVE